MKKPNHLIRHTIVVFSCALIIASGIAFLTYANFGTISTNAIKSGSVPNKASSLTESGEEIWQYNKMIRIDNTADSALTDYQVKVELNSANFDFEKADINGNDIRFTEENKRTKILGYWIENWDKTEETAIVWVKIPRIPASSTKKIYIHYGNSLAVSTGNGNFTFEFFDDFETDKGWVFNISHKDWVPDYLDGYGERTNEYYVSPETSYKLVWSKSEAGSTKGYVKIQTSKSFDSTGGERIIDLKHKLASIHSYTDVTIFIDYSNEIWRRHSTIDWTEVNTENFILTPGSHTIYLRFLQNKDGTSASGGVSYWDDVRVRKYVSPEPSVTIGKEKTVH